MKDTLKALMHILVGGTLVLAGMIITPAHAQYNGGVREYANWDDDAGGDETISVTTSAKRVGGDTGYCQVTINASGASGTIYWGGVDVSTTGGNSLGPAGAVAQAVTLNTSAVYLIAAGTITGVRITLGKC